MTAAAAMAGVASAGALAARHQMCDALHATSRVSAAAAMAAIAAVAAVTAAAGAHEYGEIPFHCAQRDLRQLTHSANAPVTALQSVLSIGAARAIQLRRPKRLNQPRPQQRSRQPRLLSVRSGAAVR